MQVFVKEVRFRMFRSTDEQNKWEYSYESDALWEASEVEQMTDVDRVLQKMICQPHFADEVIKAEVAFAFHFFSLFT